MAIKNDLAHALAEHVAGAKYEDLPPSVIETTKTSILDTLGVMLAASTAGQGCKETVDLVKDAAGKQESTIMGFGGKVPCMMAAFANGSLAHAIDYDDVLENAQLHPSAATIPAAMAIAERAGRVDGRQFITAVAMGIDVISRMGLSITQGPLGPGSLWNMTPTFSVFAASAACGRLLGLDSNGILNAFGIALHQAAGTVEIGYSVNATVRGLYNSFPARAGVTSALMAYKGIVGTRNVFEGKAGLFNVYFNGKYDPSQITADLGKKFPGSDVSFKAWPACRTTHQYIDGTLSLVREHDIRPEDIEVMTPVAHVRSRRLCEPLEERQNPETIMDAKFSIPFTMALAVLRRNVVIGDFTLQGLKDPAVLQLAQKVTPKLGDVSSKPGVVIPPATIVIKTKDGKEYSTQVGVAYGDPQKPLPRDVIIQKFRDCASYSARPLSPEQVERAIRMVSSLEEVEDVAKIVQVLS